MNLEIISPGLYRKEKEGARGFIIISSLLFFIGVLFGYYIVTPLSINFLGNYTISSEVFNDFDLSSYIGLLRASVLASGLIFELPIIIHYLTKVGLVTPDFLRRNRKFNWTRRLIRENDLSPSDLILPIFLTEGKNKRSKILNMPGVFRYSIDLVPKVIDKALKNKIPILLEKPISHEIDSAKKIVNFSKKYKTPLLIGFHRRHNLIISKAKRYYIHKKN